MSGPDLHPDELLDKEARGVLSAQERISLDDHLAQCTVCRFERSARRDFQDELAAGGPEVEVEHLVARVLGGTPAQRTKPSEPRQRRKMTPLLVAAVAAAMSIASAAVAARWTGVWPSVLAPVTTTPAASPPSTALDRATSHRAPVLAAPPREASSAPIAPATAPAFAAAAKKPSPESPERNVGVLHTPAKGHVPEEDTKTDAAALFAQANHARASGQHAGAVRLYRELLGRFPGSPETRLSRATLGRLLLDDGDAAGALVELDQYLRDGDLTLREEAIANRAMALGRLGRTSEEVAAWSTLLDSYPRSIHGGRARTRIRELGPR